MLKTISLLVFLLLSFLNCLSINLKGEIHHPKTADNWPLTIEHLPPLPGTAAKKYPVIICHGLIGNRNYFKIPEENSLPAILQKEGYDVWLLDLRGRPDAGSPSLFFGERTYSQNFDDYAKSDVDAAIKFVQEKTGKDKVNWIGHSMGGMVIYARAGSMGEDRIASLVTFGSPFQFHNPSKDLKKLNGFRGMTKILPNLPASTAANFSSYVYVPGVSDFFLNLFYYSKNMTSDEEKKLQRLSVSSEGKGVLNQFSDTIEKGEIYSSDKKTSYTANLKNITIPSLLIAGRRDHLGSPYIVRHVYDSISSKDKTMLVAGRGEGYSEDYGHVDLVMGSNSKELYYPVANWLNTRNK